MLTVKVLGPLGDELGQNTFKLDFTGSTLADVIDRMATKYGGKVKEELLDEEGNLDYAYGIFRDGERLADLTDPVQDGAELVIVIMMAGG